jgi:parvulin-like peptidyl-prolyl cis-trans isomerase-like protein/SurA-like protein
LGGGRRFGRKSGLPGRGQLAVFPRDFPAYKARFLRANFPLKIRRGAYTFHLPMLESIRKRQRTLLTIITVVVIVAFAWFYNPATMRRAAGPGGAVGNLNGRVVTVGDLQKIERTIPLIHAMGLDDFLTGLTTDGRNRDDQFLSFAWNLLLLRDEAKRLEIEPGTEQIRDSEKALPIFQTNNAFDPAKYQQFVDTMLKPNGLTPGDLDEVAKDYARFTGVTHLLEGSSPFPEAMFRRQYELLNQQLSLAVIRFKKADFESLIKVTDKEVQKYYDQHKETILSPEKRKIQVVSFLLSDEQKKLPEEQKLAAKRPLAEQADAFAQAALQNPATFDKLAREKGFTIQETQSFTLEQPDQLIAQESGLVRQAFNLTTENPVGDVIEGNGGFYVIKLTNVESSRPLTLEEAKDRVQRELKDEKLQTAIQAKAKEVREKIDAEMQNGKGFVEAAEAAGYKPETPAPFSLVNPGNNLELARTMAIANLELNDNQTSKFLEDQDGGLIIHMLKREPIDEVKYEEYKSTEYAQQNSRYESIVLREWLKAELQKAGRPPFLNRGATG